MSNNKMSRDDLGTRMKTYYEGIPKTRLMRRMPVIIRIDGKAFHTFTSGFQRPFDDVLIKTMQETTKYLCENIQGCVLGYTQSDEISLILIDYQKLDTEAWFDYEIQKMCSIAASMATMAFNKLFAINYEEWKAEYLSDASEALLKLNKAYMKALKVGAMFDARVFNIPKEEVTNCIYWRQLDASRNSIQMTGQANFSRKELHCKSCNDIQDMLMTQKGINWNDFPAYQKRGSCVIRAEENETVSASDTDNGEDTAKETTARKKWIIDREIPIFKGENRDYIERLI